MNTILPNKLNKSGESLRGLLSASGERKNKERVQTAHSNKRLKDHTIKGIIGGKLIIDSTAPISTKNLREGEDLELCLPNNTQDKQGNDYIGDSLRQSSINRTSCAGLRNHLSKGVKSSTAVAQENIFINQNNSPKKQTNNFFS